MIAKTGELIKNSNRIKDRSSIKWFKNILSLKLCFISCEMMGPLLNDSIKINQKDHKK